MAYANRYFGGNEVIRVPSSEVMPWWADTPASPALLASRRRYVRRKANTQGAPYVATEIAERDRHRCHLCGCRVDMSLPGSHMQGPTIDHLIPVSQGGGDEAHNVALAHRRCNIRRGVRGTVQLRAF